jgi:hypothetical protein
VKGWFSHKKTATNRATKNLFLDWLEGFKRPGTTPRKLPLYKFFMQHDEYAQLVEDRFEAKWSEAGLESRFALDFWCKCAKDLLEEQDEETRAALATELDRDHEEALAQHNGRVDGIANPEAPDPEKSEA